MLRNSALDWLRRLPSEMIRGMTSLERWIEALTAEFKMRRPRALQEMKSLRYTPQDAASQKPLSKYAEKMVRLCRHLGYSEIQTLDKIWENIYSDLTPYLIDLHQASLHRTLREFKAREDLIFNYFRRHRAVTFERDKSRGPQERAPQERAPPLRPYSNWVAPEQEDEPQEPQVNWAECADRWMDHQQRGR